MVGIACYVFERHAELGGRLIAVALFLGCSFLDYLAQLLVLDILQRKAFVQLHLEHFVSGSFKGGASGEQLEQHYAYGVNVGRGILVHDIAYHEFGSGVGSLSHELSGGCQLTVLSAECIDLLGDAEVDYLYLSVGGHEDVARVDVAVYVALVVQSHDSRQYVDGDSECKFRAVGLCKFVELACIGYFLALLVDDVAFEQILQHHAVQ